MIESEKRIEQLERSAAEAALLAKLAGTSAQRTYNTMLAEDLIALAKTLRTPGIAARVT
jgi:hypothetical protein